MIVGQGITLDITNKRLYMAISDVGKAMLSADPSDKGGPDHIKLPKNICGCVYQMDGMGASDWKVG